MGACGPDNADTNATTPATGDATTEPTTTEPTTGEPTTSTTAELTTSTTAEPTTSTTEPTTDGPAVDPCESGTAVEDLSIAWGMPLSPCDSAMCMEKREAACTVEAIASDGPTVLTLACTYEGIGSATDIVTLDLDPGAAIDLAVGAAVELDYEAQSVFEKGGSHRLRITDDRGLVLAAGYIGQNNFLDVMTWAGDFLAELAAPLTATAASAGCTDPKERTAVTLGVPSEAVDVIVGEGQSAILTASSGLRWLVVVEIASAGRIHLAIMRITQ